MCHRVFEEKLNWLSVDSNCRERGNRNPCKHIPLTQLNAYLREVTVLCVAARLAFTDSMVRKEREERNGQRG